VTPPGLAPSVSACQVRARLAERGLCIQHLETDTDAALEADLAQLERRLRGAEPTQSRLDLLACRQDLLARPDHLGTHLLLPARRLQAGLIESCARRLHAADRGGRDAEADEAAVDLTGSEVADAVPDGALLEGPVDPRAERPGPRRSLAVLGCLDPPDVSREVRPTRHRPLDEPAER